MRRTVRIVQQISFSLIIKFLNDFFLNLGFALFRPKMNWHFYKQSLADDWFLGISEPGVSPRAIISRPFRA
jgi:hypothetical protein